MKIEKLNDHQIRCTLTKEDLDERNIKLGELAYGSENTRTLFRDMMQQAAIDFGFEADDIPLMIEAIPMSPDKIVLIVTKVESPDELDPRFSNFTSGKEETEELSGEMDEDGMPGQESPLPNDLLYLLEQLHKEQHSESEKSADSKNAAPTAPQEEIIRLFRFQDLNEIFPVAQILKYHYTGKNSIYKDTANDLYYLVLRQSGHSISEFNKIHNIVASHLKAQKYKPDIEAFFKEHYKTILADHALQDLANV